MEFFASASNATGPAFCPHCGTILDHPDTNNIVCSACEYRCQYQGALALGANILGLDLLMLLTRATVIDVYVHADLPSLTVVTHSEDKPAPKWLKTEKVMTEVTGPSRATVEETCPKCGNLEMDYYTLQLRSADEGQTVFYECKKCGHKFSVNN